jgi:acetate kinase
MKTAVPCILSVNGGSSSIKFALFEATDSLDRILEGGLDRIGSSNAIFHVKANNPIEDDSRPVSAPDHAAAVGVLMDWIEKRSEGATLIAVGHRVLQAPANYRRHDC